MMATIRHHPTLYADVTLLSGDELSSLPLTHVGVDGDGYHVYAPPYPIDVRHIASIYFAVLPDRTRVDFSRGTEQT